MSPGVSVIVPVYNSVGTLDRCVRSLLAQSFRDIEIILVNDGSTDGSGAVCDAFGREDHRVIVAHKGNGGLSDARNTGLSLAKGEYVAFLDSDDWAQEDMLSEMASAAKSTSSDVVIAGSLVDVLDERDRLISTRRILPGSGGVGKSVPPLAITDDLINLLGYAWNKLYSRSLLREASCEFIVGLSLIEDMIFNARALTKASSIVLLNTAFVHYVQRPRETLGTTFYSDYLAMRLRAIDAVGAVLEHWGVGASQTDPLKGRLSLVAFRNLARRSIEHRDRTIRQRAESFRRARTQVDGALQFAGLRGRQRVEFHLLRHMPATFVMLVFYARDRFRTIGTAR